MSLFLSKFQRRRLVAALLDKHGENFTFLVDGPPHEHPFAVDPDYHLVEVPHTVGASTDPADVGRYRWAKLVGPAAHGLIADIDPALGQHVLDVAQAGGEAENRARPPAGRPQAGSGGVCRKRVSSPFPRLRTHWLVEGDVIQAPRGD